MKLYILKCFWDHKRIYFVLVRSGSGWDWVNIGSGNNFSSGHESQENAIDYAKDQGIVKGITLDYLYSNMNTKEGSHITKLVKIIKERLESRFMPRYVNYRLNRKDMKLIIEIFGQL